MHLRPYLARLTAASTLAFALALTTGCASGPVLRVGVGGDVTAQHRAPAPAPADAAPPRAWLWEISGGPAAEPSYVLGTMHIGVTRRRALPPPLDEHLHQSRVLVMEVDPREVEHMFQSARPTRVPRRQWLDRALPSATWQLLVGELGHLVPADQLRRVPPGPLAHHLALVRMAEIEALEDGREPVRGAASTARLDHSIYEWSVMMGRALVPLETPEQAMSALERLPRGDALDSLRRVLEHAEEAREEQRGLREAYLAFDPQRVRVIIDDMSADEREILLLERNRAWMERLLPELERGRAFVAVGLAHLLGEQSVLAMLVERGYHVRSAAGGQ